MVGRKKTRNTYDEDPSGSVQSPPTKRQRVSLACDPCRMAKSKCDGDRPCCGTCLLQSKSCSYTHATRKRGVPPGYLRSMEVAMGWIFEYYPGSEAALHQLLTQNNDADGAQILMAQNEAGGRFRRRWNKSSVYRDINRLVSAEGETQTDGPRDEPAMRNHPFPETTISLESTELNTNSEASFPPHINLSIPRQVIMLKPMHLVLPSNWKHLVEVYFTYTGCWLPIIERDCVTRTASLYANEGLDIECRSVSSSHIQLWSVLAVASFQDAACSITPSGSLSPHQIYAIACELSATDNGIFEVPYISSILLQSLIKISQKKELEAWLLIGKASRLSLSALPIATSHNPTCETNKPCSRQTKLLAAASFILDTLVSVYLGRPGMAGSGGATLPPDIFTESVEPTADWVPVLNFGKASCGNRIGRFTTFRQLYIFCQLWTKSSDTKKTTPEEILNSIDPQFSFCNSLIFGGSIPEVPSAFLIQAMLLTITLHLAPSPRPALSLNLLELVELCIESLGPCGAPPVFIILMKIGRQFGHSELTYPGDKDRWKSAQDSLENVWGFDGLMNRSRPENSIVQTRTSLSGTASSSIGYEGAIITNETIHQCALMVGDGKRESILLSEGQILPTTPNEGILTNTVEPRSSQHVINPLVTLTASTHGDENSEIMAGVYDETDDDALLDELGSISYANITDTNLQFMANLGFAPGYDLGEMFLSDFNI